MSNYACIILELNWNRCFRHYKTNWTFGIIYLCRPDNCKTGNLTSWKERKRLRNVLKWKMHVQSYYFHCKVCKFVTRSLPLSSWLLKLSNSQRVTSHKWIMSKFFGSKLFAAKRVIQRSESLPSCIYRPCCTAPVVGNIWLVVSNGDEERNFQRNANFSAYLV